MRVRGRARRRLPKIVRKIQNFEPKNLPVKVTPEDIELPLGMADDGITHKWLLFLIPIIAIVIHLAPQLSKTH